MILEKIRREKQYVEELEIIKDEGSMEGSIHND